MNEHYIIITPAFNEARYVGKTIESVIAQSIKPKAWVIVDDGSTDETADIIRTYTTEHAWIRYVHRAKVPGQSYFGSNVNAIMDGYEQVKKQAFVYAAILDADISLPVDYYETVLSRFEKNPELGIASGIYENLIDGKLHSVLSDRRSTPKAIMIFRREVFEQIGGFLPLSDGGEDTAACIMARMKGWKTWSYPCIKVVHHRPTGLGGASSTLNARYAQGKSEYGLGSHPLFIFLKSMQRCVKEKPFIAGGFARFCGYLAGYLQGIPRQVPREVVIYNRNEQIKRLLSFNRIDNQLLTTSKGN